MSERLAKMEAQESRRNLESLVSSKGLDPKVADLVPKDADPEAWLKDYGNLFARAGAVSEAQESVEEDVDTVPADEQDALSGIAASAQGAQPKAGLDALEAQIHSAGSEEELLKILQSNG